LIEWILRQLEKQPSTLFYETGLREKSDGEFLRLKERNLLICVQPNSVSEIYGYGQAKPRIAVNLDGLYCAIDDESPETGLLFLDRAELIKYSFSFKTFAKELATANHFSDSPEKLHRRLYFAGERKIDRSRVALVLAFIDQDKSAENLLLGLPGRLPSGFNQFYVVTPSYTVKSLELRERLERQQIFVTPLEDFERFKLDLSPLVKEGTVIFTPQQEEECRLYGFIYRIPIHITGERGGKASNYVSIGDRLVSIGDAPFALFLRLVLGLHNEKTGEVPKPDLYEEGYFKKDEDEYQRIDRLRQRFINIPGIDRLEFIKDQNKSLKLSVHPSLITWDLDQLLNHTDLDILKLSKQLPKKP